MTTILESQSEKDTEKTAEDLAKKCRPGAVLALTGDLGVGKTAFAKGFAKGLLIEEPIVSPTFTILQVYENGRMPLYHFDVYRIDDPGEMEEIGYRDYFYGDGVTIVEWPELIEELIPDEAVRVTITKDTSRGFDYRRIEVKC